MHISTDEIENPCEPFNDNKSNKNILIDISEDSCNNFPVDNNSKVVENAAINTEIKNCDEKYNPQNENNQHNQSKYELDNSNDSCKEGEWTCLFSL